MTIERQLVGTTDASASASVYIEDCFSCTLYTGTGASQTITNGIDLSTKGGMVWVKGRSGATDHAIYDTARGATYDIGSNLTTAQTTQSTGLTAFGTTGFTIGALAKLNTSAATYTSFAFRKQAKFFTICTWTGNGTTQNISHDLGVTPGMIIVKSSSITNDWTVWHRSLTSGYKLALNSTGAANNTVQNNYFGNNSAVVAPTSTQFTIGSNYNLNQNAATYVAYLFADSNSGGFGASGTDSVVACGSFTTGSFVNLGWEPQFILSKLSTGTQAWLMSDDMRGLTATNNLTYLSPNSSAAEVSGAGSSYNPSATGFTPIGFSAGTHIYLAIRRGPMKTPTDATKVFSVNSTNAINTNITTGFPVDYAMAKGKGGTSGYVATRLTGSSQFLISNATDAESSYTGGWKFDLSDAFLQNQMSSAATWMFRRAPGFFDVVCYTGTGSATTVAHNLGVAPELMIVKRRSNTSYWFTYNVFDGPTKYLYLNVTDAVGTSSAYWNNTSPTASAFTIGGASGINYSGDAYVAYLFATCPGVSKCGSYTGSGTTKQIDCGFTSGARFVLIKRTDSTGDWYVWDTARGIISANDPYLLLNSTAAEVTSTDYIDPYSAGFEISSSAPAAINASGGTFIYLAIA